MLFLKRIILIMAMLAICTVCSLIFWNNHLYHNALASINSEKKIKTFARANRFNSFNDLIYFEMGKAYLDLGIQNLFDQDLSRSFFELSHQSFKESLQINPFSHHSHFQNAQSLLYLSYMVPSPEDPFKEYELCF